MRVPEDDNVDDGYTRLAATILLKAWLDLHQGNQHAESAREFLSGPLAADLARLLGLDPGVLRSVSGQGGQLPRWLIGASEARALLGRYRLEDKTRRGLLSVLRIGGHCFYYRREIAQIAQRAGIPVEKGR